MTYEQKVVQWYWDLEDKDRQPLRRKMWVFSEALRRVRDCRNAVEDNRKMLAEYQAARIFLRKATHFTNAAWERVLTVRGLGSARIDIREARAELKDRQKALAEKQARAKRERSQAEARYTKTRARLANAIIRTQKRRREGR